MRLLLDEMWSPVIAQQLRRRGHDAVASSEREDLRGLSDEEVLTAAARDRRVIVTRDVGDFSQLILRWGAEGRDHWGVIFVSPRRFSASRADVGPLVRALEAILKARPGAGDLVNARAWLS